MFLKQKVIIGYNPLFLVEKTDFKEDKLLKYIDAAVLLLNPPKRYIF